MSRSLKGLMLGLVMASAMFGQLPVKVTDGLGTEQIIGASGKKYLNYSQAITTAGVVITSSNTYVNLLFCSNNTSGAVTLTVTDNQGSPVTFFPATSMAANSAVLLYAGPIGLYMQGIKITAGSNSAISCQVQGVQ